jgi:hypothetical protein
LKFDPCSHQALTAANRDDAASAVKAMHGIMAKKLQPSVCVCMSLLDKTSDHEGAPLESFKEYVKRFDSTN